MKKIGYLLFAICYLLLCVYLLLPAPKIAPLPGSLKSVEPGDTGRISNITAAYYTNLSREEIISFYQKSFSQSSFFNVPLITYKLNHPPEYSKEIIIDTLDSSFFEEIVHPFRESFFINGWEPAKDKEYQKSAKKPKIEFIREGKDYNKKVTLFYIKSNPFIRIVIFHLSILAIFSLIYFLRSIFASKWRIK